MSISAIQPALAGPVRTPAQLDRGTLRALRNMGRLADPHNPAVVRDAAAQMVSELFFKPLLAEMREFPFGAQFASGGRGEAVFAEQLDQYIADAVAAADRDGLVTQLARRLQKAPEPAGPSASTAEQTAGPPAQASWVTSMQAQPVPGGRAHE